MSNIRCKHCKNLVVPETEHHCREMQRIGIPAIIVPKTPEDNDGGCFITSAVIASATESAVIGTILGGDPAGAVVGDVLTSNDRVDRPSTDDAAIVDDDDTSEPAEPSEDEDVGGDEDDWRAAAFVTWDLC